MAVWRLIAHHADPDAQIQAFLDLGWIAIGWTRAGDLRQSCPASATEITQLIQANAQVVIPNLTTEDAARFIQQARARGLKAIFLSPDTNLTNLRIYKLSAGAAEGLITATNQSEGDTPSYHAFVVAFTKRFGRVDDPSYSGYGYDAMMILAHAMTKAETTSNREAVKTALASMRSVCASICYKNDGHGAFLTPKLYFVKLVKGHWVPATELK